MNTFSLICMFSILLIGLFLVDMARKDLQKVICDIYINSDIENENKIIESLKKYNQTLECNIK